MATCNRWDTEGLLARERGERLDPHFDTCPDCETARAADAQLAARILDAGAGWSPPGDWEARVFARIAQEKPARRFQWWWALLPTMAAAGLVAALLYPRPPVDRSPGAITFTVTVIDAAQVLRGENPKPGDVLSVRIASPDASRSGRLGVRIYRDDRTLVYACGAPETCPRDGEVTTISTRMEAPGAYQTLLLSGEAVLPAPAGSLDADVAAARAVGLQVTLGEPVRVY